MSDDPKDVGKLSRLKPSNPNIIDVGEAIVNIDEHKGDKPLEAIIPQRMHIQSEHIERATQFWKPLYFNIRSEGRLLNGIEAYELGDDKIRAGKQPDKIPYIAMSNLMALEALRLLGDTWPTVEAPEELMFGTDREKLVADFWKDTFAPTAFQANWAWSGVLAVLAGEPGATRELLYAYKEQLP